jgi:hypothetical protein
VPWASALVWAAESSPAHRAWAVSVRGRRTGLGRSARRWPRCWRPGGADLAASWRWRGLGAVVGPGGPAGVDGGERCSHGPSRRSSSRRSWSACSARAASDSPSTSWVARPSRSAASAATRSGGLPVGWSPRSHEHLFEFMAATYQAHTRRQAPTQLCGQLFREHRTEQFRPLVCGWHGRRSASCGTDSRPSLRRVSVTRHRRSAMGMAKPEGVWTAATPFTACRLPSRLGVHGAPMLA